MSEKFDTFFTKKLQTGFLVSSLNNGLPESFAINDENHLKAFLSNKFKESLEMNECFNFNKKLDIKIVLHSDEEVNQGNILIQIFRLTKGFILKIDDTEKAFSNLGILKAYLFDEIADLILFNRFFLENELIDIDLNTNTYSDEKVANKKLITENRKKKLNSFNTFIAIALICFLLIMAMLVPIPFIGMIYHRLFSFIS